MGLLDNLNPISAGISAVGTIAGLWGSANSNKRYDRKMNSLVSNRERSLATTFNNDYSKDFFDTDVAKSTLRTMNDNYTKRLRATESGMAKQGATEEAKIAGRTAANETHNEGLVKLSGYGTQYKDNLKRDYESQLRDLFGVKAGVLGQKHASEQASFANLGQNASNLAGSTGTILDEKPEITTG